VPKLMSSILRYFSHGSANHTAAGTIHGRLPVTVSLLDAKTRAVMKQPAPAIQGYLRDINRKGLSFVMSSVNCSDPFFICSSHLLLVTLRFQNRDVGIEVFPVRYNIDESQGEYKYLIGARILRIARSDRRYIQQYLKSRSGFLTGVLSSIAHGVYGSIARHFRKRRDGMQLPLHVSIFETKALGAKPPLTTPGHLNDISKTGLSVMIPSVRFGDRYPVGDGYTLRITIRLPNRLMKIGATPIRYNKLGASAEEQRYLIGAQITEIEATDRKELLRYIKQIKKRRGAISQTEFSQEAEQQLQGFRPVQE
jgi:hypothetical protein